MTCEVHNKEINSQCAELAHLYNKYDAVFWHDIVAIGNNYFSSACSHVDSIKCFSDKEVGIGIKYTITCAVDGGSAPNKVEFIKPDKSKLIWTDTGFVFCFFYFLL